MTRTRKAKSSKRLVPPPFTGALDARVAIPACCPSLAVVATVLEAMDTHPTALSSDRCTSMWKAAIASPCPEGAVSARPKLQSLDVVNLSSGRLRALAGNLPQNT